MPAAATAARPTADRVSVLVVDDDDGIRQLLERYLREHGFDVLTSATASDCRARVAHGAIDLLLLDLGLPDEDGLLLLRFLQAEWRGPVIVLSGRGEAVERVVGLELGADDYITKPFDLRELLARIRSVLRRTAAPPPPAQEDARVTLRFAGFVLDPAARRLLAPDGGEVALTPGEFALLHVLLEHPNRVLSRDQLLTRLHGRGAGPYDRSIDVQIGRLRRKLGDDPAHPQVIRSVRGSGYMLAAAVQRAG